MNDILNLKNKIKLVILESYYKSETNNFKDLNFFFEKNKSKMNFLKNKIKILNGLDEYSQTFLSIYTKAKIVLREFNTKEFKNNYVELLRLTLTLPEQLNSSKLKHLQTLFINNENKKIEKKLDLKKINENIELKNKTILINIGIDGKKLKKQKQDREELAKEINSINFGVEELSQEEDLMEIGF